MLNSQATRTILRLSGEIVPSVSLTVLYSYRNGVHSLDEIIPIVEKLRAEWVHSSYQMWNRRRQSYKNER